MSQFMVAGVVGFGRLGEGHVMIPRSGRGEGKGCHVSRFLALGLGMSEEGVKCYGFWDLSGGSETVFVFYGFCGFCAGGVT